jgi:peptidoglycan-N-acetylglucosamine deacetylase
MFGVSVSVDVDGEAGLPDGGARSQQRLSSRSERVYGITRGLPRILDALAEHTVTGTFYVPGLTAQRHPEAVHAILAGGHELAHHGHTHRRPDTLTAAEQAAELTDALHALTELAGHRPAGYRAPGWELTPTTLALLAQHGFAYDSSLMDDDRPYRLANGLIELPVHWTLDDAPHFAHTTDPTGLLECWLAEHDHARAEHRHLTYTLHPDILGRPHRHHILHRLLDHLDHHNTPTHTHHHTATTHT